MIESVLASPDPRQQVLELCLKDSKGSYEPAAIDMGRLFSYKVG
jgi:hypothetical protein